MTTGACRQPCPHGLVFALVLLAAGPVGADKAPSSHQRTNPNPIPWKVNGVTAHRGYSSRYPENTMVAFKAASKSGADWIECDVYQTRDQRLVVTHDPTTARVAERDLEVAASTYDQLSKLDVATGFRKVRHQSKHQCPPAHMPLLKDVLQWIKTQRRVRLTIQPKQNIVDEIVAMVQKQGAGPWVGVNDGSLPRLQRVKQLAPSIHTFYDTSDGQTQKHIRQSLNHDFDAIVMHAPTVTADKVRRIEESGLESGAWTVNDPERMRDLLQSGIDRIFTNRPKRLLEVKHELGS